MADKKIIIEGTRFIYATNFAGEYRKEDRYPSTIRKGNIVVPNNMVNELMTRGVRVKKTYPKEGYEEGFETTYFVPVTLSYRDPDGTPKAYPPRVFLVPSDDDFPVLLTEDTIGKIDNIRVQSVNVVLNPWNHLDRDGNMIATLYVQTMYVNQDTDEDPFYKLYNWPGKKQNDDETLPFN